MADASFEDVLSKLTFSPVNSKDFLTLLFQTDEKGVDYLSSLKKQFKEKYVIPTYKKAQNVYEKIGKNLTEAEKQENLKLLGDPLDIISLNKEYKEKTKQIFEEKLKTLKSSVIINPADAQKTLKSSSLSAIIPESAAQPKEQATFTEKIPKVTLSDETLEDLKGVLNLKDLKVFDKSETKPEEIPQSSLLSTLVSLLAMGGVAGILISMFWDKIKPWLEDKFGFNLDFLDKFEGTLNAISKFFTTGGLSIAGSLLKIQGNVIKSLGELIESSVGGIFKTLLGEGAEKGLASGIAKFASGGTLTKIAGSILGGVGIVTLKSLPVIGALISFGFAYNRFQDGDTIGGIIDIVGGIANLLSYTPLAPLAIPISLGAAVLNAFLDYNAGDGTTEQKQQRKLDFIGKITDFIRGIPFVGWIMNFAQGFYEIGSGNFEEGIDYLMMQPFLGPFPAIIKSIMDATATDEQGNTRFSFDTFSKKLKSNMGKWLINQVPNWFGAKKMLADFLGIDYNETTGEVMDSQDPYNLEGVNKQFEPRFQKIKERSNELKPEDYTPEKEKELMGEINRIRSIKDDIKKQYEESQKGAMDGWNPLHDEEKEKSLKTALENLEDEQVILQNQISNIRQGSRNSMDSSATEQYKENKPITIPPAENSLPLFFDKLKSQEPSPDIVALRPQANFDQGIKQLTGIIESINKGVYKMTNDIAGSVTSKLNTGGNGGVGLSVATQAGNNVNDLVLSGSRDSIYELRSSWWRRTSNLREMV
jgi:hypothetical protein